MALIKKFIGKNEQKSIVLICFKLKFVIYQICLYLTKNSD